MEDGKKFPIRILQVHAADNCNFHCNYCTAGSPQSARSLHSYADFHPHLERLSEYATVGKYDVMGGEPFMNPDLCEVVTGFNFAPIKAPVNVVTNGFWLRDWQKIDNQMVLNMIDSFEVTIHPELKIPTEEVESICAEITDKVGVKHRINYPDVFFALKFVEEPIHRKSCKFCPQLLASGFITKCHIIAYNHLYTERPPQQFLDLQSEGIYEIEGGDYESLKEWYTGRGDGLHDACNHCRFMEDKTAVEEHNV